ncbi:MAG TPA: phasin [Pararhizobium sp.]|nr:phasin [Pararhizobium sp.]
MATRKTETADAFAFAAFDPAKVTDSYRDFAEKSMAQTRDAYGRFRAAAEDTTKTIEATLESAQAGSVELGLKAIDFMRVNTGNSLSHFEALLGVKSVAEVIELQTTFFRKQLELGVDQAKALQETSRKVAEEVARPGKSAVDKAVKESKAA